MKDDILGELVKSNFSLDCFQNSHNELYLTLHAKDYGFYIDENLAKCLISYQKTIYKLFSLAKYGSPDVSFLTKEEKEDHIFEKMTNFINITIENIKDEQ